jgi:hypothetical protein
MYACTCIQTLVHIHICKHYSRERAHFGAVKPCLRVSRKHQCSKFVRAVDLRETCVMLTYVCIRMYTMLMYRICAYAKYYNWIWRCMGRIHAYLCTYVYQKMYDFNGEWHQVRSICAWNIHTFCTVFCIHTI